MRVYGPWRADCLLDEYLTRGVRDMVFPANHMSNAHLKIVHDNGKMVEWLIHASRDYKISKLRGIKRYFTANLILKYNGAAGIAQTHHRHFPARLVFGWLF